MALASASEPSRIIAPGDNALPTPAINCDVCLNTVSYPSADSVSINHTLHFNSQQWYPIENISSCIRERLTTQRTRNRNTAHWRADHNRREWKAETFDVRRGIDEEHTVVGQQAQCSLHQRRKNSDAEWRSAYCDHVPRRFHRRRHFQQFLQPYILSTSTLT